MVIAGKNDRPFSKCVCFLKTIIFIKSYTLSIDCPFSKCECVFKDYYIYNILYIILSIKAKHWSVD